MKRKPNKQTWTMKVEEEVENKVEDNKKQEVQDDKKEEKVEDDKKEEEKKQEEVHNKKKTKWRGGQLDTGEKSEANELKEMVDRQRK